MNTDPIADYLTRVRNAIRANHKVVSIPASNLKKEITKILFDQGYILSYKFEDNSAQGSIKIALKYTKENNESVYGPRPPEIVILEERLTRSWELWENASQCS